MSCQPKFEPGIKLDCIREIIGEVRDSGASLATAKKLAWVIGCAIDQFDGDQFDGEIVTLQVRSQEVPSTSEGCCGRLEEVIGQPSTQAISLELIALLLKLAELIIRISL